MSRSTRPPASRAARGPAGSCAASTAARAPSGASTLLGRRRRSVLLFGPIGGGATGGLAGGGLSARGAAGSGPAAGTGMSARRGGRGGRGYRRGDPLICAGRRLLAAAVVQQAVVLLAAGGVRALVLKLVVQPALDEGPALHLGIGLGHVGRLRGRADPARRGVPAELGQPYRAAVATVEHHVVDRRHAVDEAGNRSPVEGQAARGERGVVEAIGVDRERVQVALDPVGVEPTNEVGIAQGNGTADHRRAGDTLDCGIRRLDQLDVVARGIARVPEIGDVRLVPDLPPGDRVAVALSQELQRLGVVLGTGRGVGRHSRCAGLPHVLRRARRPARRAEHGEQQLDPVRLGGADDRVNLRQILRVGPALRVGIELIPAQVRTHHLGA